MIDDFRLPSSNLCVHENLEQSLSANHRGQHYCPDCGRYFVATPVETKADEYRISRRVMNCIYNALQDYANEATYLPPRVGGVLQGCPRGDSPTPTQLAGNARLVVNLIDREVLGRSAQETSTPSPRFAGLIGEVRAPKAGDKCGHCGREWLAAPHGGQGVYHECHTGPAQNGKGDGE